MSASEKARIVWATVIGLAVIAVLSIGTWQLGWFVQEKNVERQTEIDNTRTATQTAWRDEATQTIRDIAVLDENNVAARGALTNQACDLIDKLTEQFITEPLTEFAEENCS